MNLCMMILLSANPCSPFSSCVAEWLNSKLCMIIQIKWPEGTAGAPLILMTKCFLAFMATLCVPTTTLNNERRKRRSRIEDLILL